MSHRANGNAMHSPFRHTEIKQYLGPHLVLAALALGAATPSSAAVRCIDSEFQFKAVMDAALASTDTVEEVRIKNGAYLFTSGQIGYFGVLQGTGKTLSIRGGWSGSPGACTVQDGNATGTQLSGNGQRPVFAINASTTFTGSITIENMAFTGGMTPSGSTASALSLGEQNGGVMGVLVDRVWVEGNMTAAGVSAPAVQFSSNSGLVVRNSTFASNNSGVSPPFIVAARAGQSNLILNNTIARNTSAHDSGFAGIFVVTSNGATLTLANNLFDGNIATAGGRTDIRLVTAGVSLRNNRYTGLFGTPDSVIGSTTGAAGFNGNGYDLAANSTARDAGAFYVPLFQGTLDAAASMRVQGSAVDLGSLEYSTVFEDGFD